MQYAPLISQCAKGDNRGNTFFPSQHDYFNLPIRDKSTWLRRTGIAVRGSQSPALSHGYLTNFQWDKCHQLLHARPSIYLLHMFNYPLVAAPFGIVLTGLHPIQQHIWGIIADASQTHKTPCSKEFWVAQLHALLPSCSLKFYKMSMLSTSYFHKQLRQTTWIPSSARRLHHTRLSVLFNYFALLFGKQKSLFSFLSTTYCICSPNSTTSTHTWQPLDQFCSMLKSLWPKDLKTSTPLVKISSDNFTCHSTTSH